MFAVTAFAVLIALGIALARAFMGPTVFDRILAATLVGTNGFILLIIVGFIFERIEMFIDIAITYALLNFVVAIVLAKYFERKGEKSE